MPSEIVGQSIIEKFNGVEAPTVVMVVCSDRLKQPNRNFRMGLKGILHEGQPLFKGETLEGIDYVSGSSALVQKLDPARELCMEVPILRIDAPCDREPSKRQGIL